MSRGGGGGKATPGKQYVRGEDGEVAEIAGSAYGDPSKAPRIWGANPQLKKASKLKPGQKLNIPGEKPPGRLTNKEPDDLTIVIAGREVPMLSARIMRTMDTGCDGWTGRYAWQPGQDPELDKATRPYGYPRAAAYIGNELLVGGCLYTVEPEMTDEGLVKGLHGYSFTADAVDSHVQPPYEFNNVTLKQIAESSKMLPALGLDAVFEVPVGGKFSRVTAGESDSIFAFLSKLANQRGMLVSSTPDGNMLFLKAKEGGKPVGTLSEDQPLVNGWKASYDGRKRFYAYKCITKGAKKGVAIWGQGRGTKQGPSTVIEYDTGVPRSRFLTFHADDTTPGNIKDAARWKRNRQFVEALTQPYQVTGWYAPDGTLWRENTLVTVKSATLGVPDGYTFLIRAVEYVLEENKRTATLSLIPPQAYNNKDIGDIWK